MAELPERDTGQEPEPVKDSDAQRVTEEESERVPSSDDAEAEGGGEDEG